MTVKTVPSSTPSTSFTQPGRPLGQMGRGGIMLGVQKPRDFQGTMKKLWSYLRAYRGRLLLAVLFAIASTVFTVVGPKILGLATTKVFAGVVAQSELPGTSLNIDFGYIGRIVLLLVVLYLLSALFNYLQGWLMAGISMSVTYRFRKDISEKMNRLPLKYFDGVSHGEVLSRVTNDVDTVSQTLNQSLSQIITAVTTVVGVMIMMISISWILSLVAVVIVPLSFVLMGIVISQSQKYFKQQQAFLGHVNGHVEEMFSGHLVVKAFNGEAESVEKFDRYNRTLYGSAWKSQFLSGLLFPMMNFVGNLGYVGVAMVGGWLAIHGKIAIGDIQAFIQYVRQFTQPISQIAQASNIFQQTAASAERVFEFLAEAEEVKETSRPLALTDIRGEVEFEHVHFGYTSEKIVINDFSVKVKPGQRIAIVGPTGAGKTTMVKLLMRFYDVTSGAIKIDGHDVRELTRQDLRSVFGMVLQDAWLYHATILENIRYGKLTATDAEVLRAAKAARVDHFVRTLPGGYELVLDEEASNVSQGQKQLLTIARAFLADPKILILDEATSSVDTRTEVLIQDAMADLMKNRTSFIIAHRLSTIRHADLILVMNNGDIVEQGTHEALLKKRGFYAELYNSQFASAEAVE